MSRPLLVRPTFDDALEAVVHGRCAPCGAVVTERVRHGEPRPLRHTCTNLWADFNGIDVVYQGEDALPSP